MHFGGKNKATVKKCNLFSGALPFFQSCRLFKSFLFFDLTLVTKPSVCFTHCLCLVCAGHFGSGVASYFIFLRWVFWVNVFISVFVCCFLMVPEVSMNDAIDQLTIAIQLPVEWFAINYFAINKLATDLTRRPRPDWNAQGSGKRRRNFKVASHLGL